MDRRDFLKNLGLMGVTTLAATSPWLSTFATVEDSAKERCRLGMIGPGSRGRFLLSFLAENPKCEVVALADIYQPSLDEALKIVPSAKTFNDYRQLLTDKDIDGVVIATPLNTHYQIAMDAFDAGKHVYCEKAIAYTMEETLALYHRHLETGCIFFTGQQRLFDPRYIQVMEMIHQGLFGDINAIHAFWNRNGDWRREVPSPELERLINWRLYKESSKGLMTELACHQLQVGTWALGKLPTRVMGSGAITHWKDGREVYDNVHCIYEFNDGRQMTYASVISNKFYGLEEQILGNKGTVEPERGKFYFEDYGPAPAPAFVQMLMEWEDKIWGSNTFAGSSWDPEVARNNPGEFILGKAPETDGTSLLTEAYVEAVCTQKQPPRIAEEGYYATQLCLIGHEAIVQGTPLPFPEEMKIDYVPYGTKVEKLTS